jgi:hypothetical protein
MHGARRVNRAEALTCAADIIGKSVGDLSALVSLLEIAGQLRLAKALRGIAAARPKDVGGRPRPDPSFWLRGLR